MWLKVCVEMLLAEPIEELLQHHLQFLNYWKNPSTVCLVSCSSGRDLNFIIFFNLDFVNPGVDTSEIRLSIKLFPIFGIIKDTHNVTCDCTSG